jgi:hypothetical protein
MNSDDLTNNHTDSDDDKATPVAITAIFRLLREIQNGQTGLSSRLTRWNLDLIRLNLDLISLNRRQLSI